MLLMRALIAIAMVLLLGAAASAGMVDLPIPQGKFLEAQVQRCRYEKAALDVVVEAYRVKLKELGWNCKPEDGQIVCVTEEKPEDGQATP